MITGIFLSPFVTNSKTLHAMRCVDTVPVVRVQVASEDLSFEQCRLTATEHRGIAQAIADTDVHEPSEWYSSWSEANLTAAGRKVLDVLRPLYPLARRCNS